MLCIDCARKEGALPEGLEAGPVSVDSLLKGFFGAPQVPAPGHQAAGAACPVCGMDMPKLAECGRFGCNECYKVFGDAALRIIKHIHGRKRHIGKIPTRVGGAFSLRRKIADLRAKLEAHVAREEYEEAAKLRDGIKQLEKDLIGAREVKDDVK
jgi:protein arginine kinase activator